MISGFYFWQKINVLNKNESFVSYIKRFFYHFCKKKKTIKKEMVIQSEKWYNGIISC